MSFDHRIAVGPEHIDMNGHVNNAVWVGWLQDVAGAHWHACARPEDRDRYIWLVTRHEVDYRKPAHDGDTVIARTTIPNPPKGARCQRLIEFLAEDGTLLVRALSDWAMLDAATKRPARITPDIIAPFLGATA